MQPGAFSVVFRVVWLQRLLSPRPRGLLCAAPSSAQHAERCACLSCSPAVSREVLFEGAPGSSRSYGRWWPACPLDVTVSFFLQHCCPPSQESSSQFLISDKTGRPLLPSPAQLCVLQPRGGVRNHVLDL